MKNKNQHKIILLAVALFLSPFIIHAQSLTGLWIGAVSNDSTSIRKDQSFEIALTEYKGKVYGYSRNEFIVNDTLYYIVKRVKGEIEGDLCEVTDEKIIAYNFKGKLDKNVKVISTFRRNLKDSTWYLDGTWKTKATKNFYSVSGKISLGEEKDLTASKIFPHLEELNLVSDVAFYNERKQDAVAVIKIATPERTLSSLQGNKEIPNPETIGIVPAKPDVQIVAADLPKSTAKTEPVSIAPINSDSKDDQIAKTSISPKIKEKTDTLIAIADAPQKPADNNNPTSTQKEKSSIFVTNNNQQHTTPVTENVTINQKPADKTTSDPAIPKNNQQQTTPVAEEVNINQNPADKTINKPVITKTSAELQKEKTEPVVAKNNQQQKVPVSENISTSQKPKDKTITEPAVVINPVETQKEKNEPVVVKTTADSQKEKAEPDIANNNQQQKVTAADIVKINAAQKQDKTAVPAKPEVVSTTSQPDATAATAQNKKPVSPEEASHVSISQTATEKPKVKLTAADIKTKTIDIGGRKSDFSQAVLFTSDSLEIALYDNGEIDGDTVSVYMNGQLIMSHQGLKSTAIKKTIQVPVGADEFTLVMYAESLGKLPPNTGLLVIRDGDDVYNLRFSSDFQKSSGIVLKRNR